MSQVSHVAYQSMHLREKKTHLGNVGQHKDLPLFIHQFFLRSKKIFCHFRSSLVNLGRFQFTSTMITTTSLVKIVNIQHGRHVVCKLLPLAPRGMFLQELGRVNDIVYCLRLPTLLVIKLYQFIDNLSAQAKILVPTAIPIALSQFHQKLEAKTYLTSYDLE